MNAFSKHRKISIRFASSYGSRHTHASWRENIIALHEADVAPEKTCQWINGEPRDRSFCASPSKPGSSYCEQHHAVCYVKVKKLIDT